MENQGDSNKIKKVEHYALNKAPVIYRMKSESLNKNKIR